jgi:hypothetical protein
MSEEFLHFIWKQELFEKVMISDTGETVEIVAPGQYNTDAGPDFVNARARINGVLWAGNIEIHTESGNWEKHNHQNDEAYDTVILHVVEKNNKPCFRSSGERIPAVVLSYEKRYLEKYQELISRTSAIPCNPDISKIDRLLISIWLETLCIERLISKSEYIFSILEHTHSDWEETFYISLARSFGFKTNALPFELLAKSAPLKLVKKYSQIPMQLEALMFGQAGFLADEKEDEYYKQLQKEYAYIRKVHRLNPVQKHLWKFLRIRPVNFPTIRLSQLASLLAKSESLFARTMEIQSIKQLEELFTCEAAPYWQSHYNFGQGSTKSPKVTGDTALSGIIINTIIPFLFLYGRIRGKQTHSERAIRLLEELPPEKNSIIAEWKKAGLSPENAMQSQALLQLRNNYCTPKKCLACQIGNSLIRKPD